MDRIKGLMVVLLITLFLEGCATQAELTVITQPEGAYVSEAGSGTGFGIAPVVIYYNPQQLRQSINAKGCFMVRGLEARWASGAVAATETVELCGSDVGYYTFTLSRPPSYPGLDKDLQMAMQIQSGRAQQQQASAAEAAAAAAILGTMNQNKVNCTSQNIGGIVSTNCR